MKIKRPVVLASLTGMCLASALAASTVSPLAPVPDATGESLQKTMIWTPEKNTAAGSFVAFRKRFDLTAAPRAAMLHLFADVRYMLWINGKYVLRGPARFEPTGPEYDSIDVSRSLKPGANELVALVMANASNGKMRRHAPGLAVRLEIDGRATVETDGTWLWNDQTRYRPAAVDWGNTQDRIDARVEDGDWTQPAYDDKAWKPAVKIDGGQWGPLSARRIPLLRETPVPAQFSGGVAFPPRPRRGTEAGIPPGPSRPGLHGARNRRRRRDGIIPRLR